MTVKSHVGPARHPPDGRAEGSLLLQEGQALLHDRLPRGRETSRPGPGAPRSLLRSELRDLMNVPVLKPLLSADRMCVHSTALGPPESTRTEGRIQLHFSRAGSLPR